MHNIPPDDLARDMTLSKPEELIHLAVAGDTYTILLTGKDTAGKYTLIDMYVPTGGGPPPHRHDFEESFTVVEGEIQVVFRGKAYIAHTGETVQIPANAPHQFRNVSPAPARLLCICAPAGQEEFFIEVGVPVETRTAQPPPLSEAAQAEMKQKAESLASTYKTEFLKQPA